MIPAAMHSNDMKLCSNYILYPVASLCLQQMGVPESTLVFAFTSLQLLQHHMSTAYGDSKEFLEEKNALQ